MANNPGLPDKGIELLLEDVEEAVGAIARMHPLGELSAGERLEFRIKQAAAQGELETSTTGPAVAAFDAAVRALVGPWTVAHD